MKIPNSNDDDDDDDDDEEEEEEENVLMDINERKVWRDNVF